MQLSDLNYFEEVTDISDIEGGTGLNITTVGANTALLLQNVFDVKAGAHSIITNVGTNVGIAVAPTIATVVAINLNLNLKK